MKHDDFVASREIKMDSLSRRVKNAGRNIFVMIGAVVALFVSVLAGVGMFYLTSNAIGYGTTGVILYTSLIAAATGGWTTLNVYKVAEMKNWKRRKRRQETFKK